MKIKELAARYEEDIIKARRRFHQYPEASWEEEKTSQMIKDELERMGVSYQTVAETGIVAEIKGNKPGKVVALRADIDALEVEEETQLKYKSKHQGLMHACGHDGHIAMLLGAAKILTGMKDKFTGQVKLIFQPAEEVVEGAARMIEAGVLEDIDNIFGIHLWSDLEAGKVSVVDGPIMASADTFRIEVKGKGGHGASPHQGVDAVVAASAVVMNLQTVVSRELDPLEPGVVSVGKIRAGSRFNVIANKAVMEGTIRCFDSKVRTKLLEAVKRIACNTAKSYRAEARIEYTYGTPPTVNDFKSCKLVETAVEKVLSKDAVVKLEPTTTSEDFAEYLQKVPGVFVLLGAGNEAKDASYPHHHEKFNLDEEVLKSGAALYAQYAVGFLN